MVKTRDYRLADPEQPREGETVDAPTPYGAFFTLRDSGAPLEIGDLLEAPDGSLRIFKFVGFEEAQWAVPEAKPAATNPPLPEGQPPALH